MAVASEQSIFSENQNYKSFLCSGKPVHTYVRTYCIFRGLDAQGGRKLCTNRQTD